MTYCMIWHNQFLVGEIIFTRAEEDEEIPKDVCHLCALTYFDLKLVCKINNLRTLMLYGVGDIWCQPQPQSIQKNLSSGYL